MAVSIHECLAPSYFVSYSRKQESIAHALKEVISRGARSVWFDRDSILPGDDWPNEIRSGIGAADELVLVLTEDSMASEAVAKEVDCALDSGKLIRPVAVSSLPRDLPVHLSRVHYLDVSTVIEDSTALRRLLGDYFGPPSYDARDDVTLRLYACRAIWPRFSEALVSAGGDAEARNCASRLDRLRAAYADASTIQLNAGLMLCMTGEWDAGIERLRRYARAANNFAGWYYLGLHLLRREGVLRAPVRTIDEATASLRAALSFGSHPLAVLALAIFETGGANLGPVNLHRRMIEFAEHDPRESSDEFLRAFWCLKSSFPVLGRYEAFVKARIKEMVT